MMSDLLTKILNKETIILGGNSSHMGGPSCPPDCKGCKDSREMDERERERYRVLREIVDAVQKHDRAEFREQLITLTRYVAGLGGIGLDEPMLLLAISDTTDDLIGKYAPKER